MQHSVRIIHVFVLVSIDDDESVMSSMPSSVTTLPTPQSSPSTTTTTTAYYSAKLPSLAPVANGSTHGGALSSRALLTVSSPPSVAVVNGVGYNGSTSMTSPAKLSTTESAASSSTSLATINSRNIEILDDYEGTDPSNASSTKSIVVKECTGSTLLLEVRLTIDSNQQSIDESFSVVLFATQQQQHHHHQQRRHKPNDKTRNSQCYGYSILISKGKSFRYIMSFR
jgi:hypothetical protein